MNREKELLRRLLENFEKPVTGRFGDLFDEVRELLSTPEPEQDEEPVAWLWEALSMEQKYAAWEKAKLYGCSCRFSFFAAIRFAERHYGITGGGDE